MTPDQVFSLADGFGLLGFVLVILWTGAKEVPLWVFGRRHREAIAAEQAATARERERAEEWKLIATGGLTIADKAVSKLEQDS